MSNEEAPLSSTSYWRRHLLAAPPGGTSWRQRRQRAQHPLEAASHKRWGSGQQGNVEVNKGRHKIPACLFACLPAHTGREGSPLHLPPPPPARRHRHTQLAHPMPHRCHFATFAVQNDLAHHASSIHQVSL